MATFVESVSGNFNPPTLNVGFIFNAAALGLGLIRPPDRVRLDVITADATVQETHSSEAEITEHPVEVGANITDHIRPKLKRLTIDGIISNTPIGPTGELSDKLHTAALALGISLPSFPTSYDVDAIKTAAYTTRAKASLEQLQRLVDAAQPIIIHTPLKDYPKMALESVTVVRDKTVSRGGIRFLAVCKEIRTVETLTTSAQLPSTVQPAKDIGTQSTKPAGFKLPDGSFLDQAVGRAFDKIGLPPMPRSVRLSAPGGDT
jgi:hypothetical protein